MNNTKSAVGEIYLSMKDGHVSGNVEGVTNQELAEALERMAAFLRQVPQLD